MPEEITQKLGFDASAAIKSLTDLNQKLKELRDGLKATSGQFRKFEKSAQPAIIMLREMGRAATQAAASVAQIGQAGVVPAKVGASAQGAASAMQNFGDTSAAAGAKVRQAITESFNQAGQATDKVKTKTREAGEEAKKTAKEFQLSWKTIARVVQAQVIVRSIGLLVSTFKEAQEAAREFSLRIGEVSTISGDALGSIDQISDSVLELSRSLGLAGDEVAEGLYQTLSNQVVEAGDALRFEEAAAKLSITTHSELRESVNALSSIMNSYSLDVSEVDRVSAVLFKTIELGRLRMGEFGDVLGRVSPLTEALGIEYEEMAAALAALTQKGVPAHTAITQLTAVSQKLLRPTKGLQELYEEWGVETGPEAIERFGGLRGVLLKMREATAGNDKEFADLLGRVRSMVGALNLTTNEGDALTQALEAMKDPVDDLNEAFEKTESTIGRRSVKAWNDLDVSMTQAGTTFLKITTPMVEVAATLARNFDLTAAAAIGVSVAVLAMKTSMVSSIFTVGGLTAAVGALKAALFALGPVAIVAAAAVAAALVGRAIADSLDTATEATEKQMNSQEALTKALEAQSKARIEATRKEVKERAKLIGKFVQEQEKLVRESTKIFEINAEAIGTVLGDQISEMADKRKAAIKIVEDAVNGMDDAIKDSEEIVRETQEAIAEADFEKRLRPLNEQQRVWAEIDRAARSARDAKEAYSKAGADESKIEDARKLSAIAENRAEEAVSAAQAAGNVANQIKAEKVLNDIRADRLRQEVTFQNTRKALQTSANKLAIKEAKLQQERYDKLIEKQAELLDVRDPKGGLKTEEQISEDRKRAEALEPLIKDAMLKATDIDLFKQLGVDDTTSKLRSQMENAISDATFRWDKAAESLRAELTKQSYTVKVLLDVDEVGFEERLQAQFGESTVFDPKRADEARKVAEGVISDFREFGEVAAQEGTRAAASIDNMQNRLNPTVWNNWFDNIQNRREAGRLQMQGMAVEESRRNVESEKYRQSLIAGLNTLKQARVEGRALTAEEVKKVQALKQQGAQLEANGKLSVNQLNQAVSVVESLFKGARALKAQQQALESIPAAETVEQSKTILNNLEEGAKKAGEATSQAADSADDVATAAGHSATQIGLANTSTTNWATGMNNVATAANNVTIAMTAAAEAAQRAAIAASMVSLPNAAGMAFHGGPAVNYRAAGGMASRGQDTIPVMAAPDEFFMNARSSRRFASELQAMNAGREPIFRDKGGSVTNVGDINVSVTQGESANQTARQIASSLRRELRRGTSRL
jgi:TP901 family phage tail tape measure protein